MSASQKIHFQISERKILLRVMDVVFTVLTLALIGHYTQFDYFRVSQTSFYWTIVLRGYLYYGLEEFTKEIRCLSYIRTEY